MTWTDEQKAQALEKLNHVAPLFAQAVERVPAQAANAFLAGFLANISGHVSDAQWEGMMASRHEPCGESNCGCEKTTALFMEAINALREDWKVTTGS